MKTPKILDKIADVVLSYKPPAKTKKAKKRARKRRKKRRISDISSLWSGPFGDDPMYEINRQIEKDD